MISLISMNNLIEFHLLIEYFSAGFGGFGGPFSGGTFGSPDLSSLGIMPQPGESVRLKMDINRMYTLYYF